MSYFKDNTFDIFLESIISFFFQKLLSFSTIPKDKSFETSKIQKQPIEKYASFKGKK